MIFAVELAARRGMIRFWDFQLFGAPPLLSLDVLRRSRSRPHNWFAHNMVAWFSERITVGQSDWDNAFDRMKIDGGPTNQKTMTELAFRNFSGNISRRSVRSLSYTTSTMRVTPPHSAHFGLSRSSPEELAEVRRLHDEMEGKS